MRRFIPMQARKWIPIAVGTALATPLVGMAGIGIEALVRARLDADLLVAPTRLYARRMVLQVGRQIEPDRLEAQLTRLGYRETTRRRSVDIGEYYRGQREWVIGRRSFRVYDRLDPGGVTTVRVGRSNLVTSVQDGRGRRVRSVALEPELLGVAPNSTRKDRIPVPLSQVPRHMIDAILTMEDRRFFEHSGLDTKRIAGAAVANARALRVVQGGSTLTQQLVKSLFLTNTRSPIRKMRDMAMATTLERRHSKEEILEAYLNEVYLGQDGAFAIHGVARAAQFYFGKDVRQLDVGDAALLAGIIRGPSLYSPFRRPESARRRRDLALGVMKEQGVITPNEYQRAINAPLGLRTPVVRNRLGRYYIDFVTRQLAATHGREALGGGLSVFTSLDLGLQAMAEEALRDGLIRLEARDTSLLRGDAPLQGALVALDPRTGDVLAMAGGRDYGVSQFNRAAHARRQPGSSFKPVVALAALSRAGGFTLASTLRDQPLSVVTPVGHWQPANYDRQFRGEVTLREALERSLNVPFARLGMDVGPERIVETARKLGIESRLSAVPSLALGALEMTPLEMTRAFGVLAANGYRAELQSTIGVFDAGGNIISRNDADGEQVYTAAETYLVTSALQGAVDRGTGKGLRAMGYRGAVAAKSGTTNDSRDAWFVGYTPSVAVGVWVGFDDGKPTGLSGSRAALPIFGQFLKAAVGSNGAADFSVPFGVETARMSGETGRRWTFACGGESEVFLRGTAPSGSCADRRFSRGQLARSRVGTDSRYLTGASRTSSRRSQRSYRR